MTLGVVEISDQEAKLVEGEWKTLVKTDRNEGSVGRYDNWINRTTQTLEALEKYRTGKKPLFKTRAPITLDAFEECLKDRHRIEKNTEILVHQSNKLAELQATQNKLEASRMSLKPWKDYDLPLEIKETKEVDVILGSIPSAANPDLLKQEVVAATEECTFELVNGDSEQYYVAILCTKARRQEIDEILKGYGFNRVQFGDLTGSADKNITMIDEKLAAIEVERAKVIEGIQSMEGEKPNFELLHDYFVLKRDRAQIREIGRAHV